MVKGGADKMEAVMSKRCVSSMHSAAEDVIQERDEVLDKLKESGKKLNSILNVRPRHINKAIRDTRKEWK